MNKDRTNQIESCLDFIGKQIANIDNKTLRIMCEDVILNDRFISSPGSASPKHHHAYEGGLVVHTSEVLENSLLMAESQQYNVNRDVIITGVVWHDYGKVFDYKQEKDEVGDYKKQSHYKMIKHLSRSFAEFMISARQYKLDSELVEQIGHCILSHHGRKEWGSPVEPVTPEAFIIHAADHISAECANDYYIRD